MTVKELIEKLQKAVLDGHQDKEVFCQSGDAYYDDDCFFYPQEIFVDTDGEIGIS